ncbi:lipopolysaccharide biosynthesis protein [Neobacillus sp. NPDC097160]|uniref:lipopolysaccharide biosynthesis protein n=1 Tax=Neobacillus sp. NPDC097160 TaxID=3364298 RepID=UPI0038286824
MKNNLFKNFLTYFYGSGIGLVIGLFTTVISTRLLSPEDFGKASMFTLAVNVLMIFIIFGTDQAFVRFFYEEVNGLRSKLLFNSMKIPAILLFFVILFLIIFKDAVMMFLFDEYNSLVFIVIIISIVFQVIYRFSILVIRMQQKGHLYSLMEIFNKSFNLIFLVILFYLMGSKYEILIYSAGISFVILTGISIFLEKKFWNPLSHISSRGHHSQREIFQFSYPLVLTTLISWLFQSFDRIALRQWSDFDELGLYSAAFRVVALLNVVQASFTTFWSPVCYEHFEKKPDDREFFSIVSKIIGLVMFLVAVLTILFKDIIVMLLGSDYKQAAIIMPFLIFMPMMYTMSETTVIGINFFKKTKWHIIISSVACFVNILGNFILVPPYGAAGAAVSTGLSFIVFFVLRTHLSQKYYPVNYGLKRVYFLIFCISSYALQNMIWPNYLITYLTGILLIMLIMGFYKNEIKRIFQILTNNRKVAK